MTDERKVVGTFIARRAQQLTSDDPILRAAGRATDLYGRLSMEMAAEDVFVAVMLSVRAMQAVLAGAVGKEAAASIAERATRRAWSQYSINDGSVPDVTVFDQKVVENGDKKGEETP